VMDWHEGISKGFNAVCYTRSDQSPQGRSRGSFD
jgi:hypothetical protein